MEKRQHQEFSSTLHELECLGLNANPDRVRLRANLLCLNERGAHPAASFSDYTTFYEIFDDENIAGHNFLSAANEIDRLAGKLVALRFLRRQLAKRLHPNVVPEPFLDQAHALFVKINIAIDDARRHQDVNQR